MVDEGESSRHAYVLLRGQVCVVRGGNPLSVEQREGTFVGEVAALTGGPRTARIEAVDGVYALQLDLHALEQLVSNHPAVGMRLIHALADRLAKRA